jgi:hypothetical protein
VREGRVLDEEGGVLAEEFSFLSAVEAGAVVCSEEGFDLHPESVNGRTHATTTPMAPSPRLINCWPILASDGDKAFASTRLSF